MKHVSITKWLDRNFEPDDPERPTVPTVRAWCRDGRLYPAPRKLGRSYFLHPGAVYFDPMDPASIRDARRVFDESQAA